MGLDMYMNKYRLGGHTIEEANLMSNFYDWENYIAEHPEKKCTFKEWCDGDIEKVTQELYDYFKPMYTKKYSYWDTDHKYGYERIPEMVGYWRKANQIHNWFVKNVQKGVDDCGEYVVTKKQLQLLYLTCVTVLANIKTEKGYVHNGDISKGGGPLLPNYEEGEVIVDPSIAQKLLPTTEGFFFGGTDYDEYYVYDLQNTCRILSEVIQNTDWENETITYVSSW